jgi:hypothetical protein
LPSPRSCRRNKTGNWDRLKRKIRDSDVREFKSKDESDLRIAFMSRASARSREKDQPNNSECDDQGGKAEAQHITDIVPGHALSRLARGDDRWLFRMTSLSGQQDHFTQTSLMQSGSGLVTRTNYGSDLKRKNPPALAEGFLFVMSRAYRFC